MDSHTEQKLRRYYERQHEAEWRKQDRELERMMQPRTHVRGKSQKAALRSIGSEARRELRVVERNEVPVKTLSEQEIQAGRDSWTIGSFMSWSLFDRMDKGQQYGVIMRLRERRG